MVVVFIQTNIQSKMMMNSITMDPCRRIFQMMLDFFISPAEGSFYEFKQFVLSRRVGRSVQIIFVNFADQYTMLARIFHSKDSFRGSCS